MDKALAMPATATWRRARPKRRRAASSWRRPVHVHRGVRGRAQQVDRRGRRGLGRGDVGVVEHPGPPDRQGRRHDGHPEPRPGPRDDLCPDHQPRAGRPDGGHRRPALGHPGHAVRLRVVREPDFQRGHGRRAQGAAKIRDKARRYAAHMLEANPEDIEVDGASYRVKGSPDKVEDHPGDRLCAGSRVRHPRGHGAYLDETAYHDTPNCTFRSAPTSRWSRSTRRPASWTSSATSPWTTSARRSTR